jgi:hypothetical protein
LDTSINRLHEKLDRLTEICVDHFKLQEREMATINQALTDLTNSVTQLLTDAQTEVAETTAVLTALASSETPPTQAQIAAAIETAVTSLNTIDGTLTSATATMQAALNPPAAPASPEPASTTPASTTSS